MDKRIIKRTKKGASLGAGMIPEEGFNTTVRMNVGKPGGDSKKVLPPAIIPF